MQAVQHRKFLFMSRLASDRTAFAPFMKSAFFLFQKFPGMDRLARQIMSPMTLKDNFVVARQCGEFEIRIIVPTASYQRLPKRSSNSPHSSSESEVRLIFQRAQNELQIQVTRTRDLLRVDRRIIHGVCDTRARSRVLPGAGRSGLMKPTAG